LAPPEWALLDLSSAEQELGSWSNSGQAFQILDQPDHRQRIPVTAGHRAA
jgi:hypothetical protein